MNRYLPRIFFSFLMLFVLTWTVSANGGSFRLPTSQEQTFYQTALATILQALPAGPEGWTKSPMVIQPLEKVAKGTEKGLFRIYYWVEWNDWPKKTSGEEKVQKALADYMKEHPESPELQSIQKERQRVAEALAVAISKNDSANVDRLTKVLDDLSVKLNAIMDAQKAADDAIIAKNEPHDVDLTLKITINEFYQAYEPLTPETPIAGLPVYRSAPKRTEEHGWQEGISYVFMGNNWKISNGNEMTLMKTTPVKGRIYTTAHMISLSIQGDPVRARNTLNQIHWELLKGLLK